MVHIIWVVSCIALVHVSAVGADYLKYLQLGTQAWQMQSWKKNMRNQLTHLASIANQLKAETEGLNATIQAGMETVDTHVNGFDTAIDGLNTHLDEMAASGTPYEFSYEAPPAFQAQVSTTGTTFVAISSATFKYSNVLLNYGGHYDSVTGLFTAPETGLYWLHATFTGSTNSEAVIKVTKLSGSKQVVAYMNFYNTQETACTTVAFMQTGEKAGVYPMNSPLESWSLTGGVGNNFSGYLVARYSGLTGAAAPTPAAATAAASTSPTPVAGTTSFSPFFK